MRRDAGKKIGRRPIVDRDDDDAVEETAPERDDPLGTVLAPEDNLVPFTDAERVQPRGAAPRRARDLLVRITAAAEAIVVYEELAACGGEIGEKVNERVTGHV